jgi:hypothetical protein
MAILQGAGVVLLTDKSDDNQLPQLVPDNVDDTTIIITSSLFKENLLMTALQQEISRGAGLIMISALRLDIFHLNYHQPRAVASIIEITNSSWISNWIGGGGQTNGGGIYAHIGDSIKIESTWFDNNRVATPSLPGHATGAALAFQCTRNGLDIVRNITKSWHSPCNITMNHSSWTWNRVLVRVWVAAGSTIPTVGSAMGASMSLVSPLPIRQLTITQCLYHSNIVRTGLGMNNMDWPYWLSHLPFNRAVSAAGGCLSITHTATALVLNYHDGDSTPIPPPFQPNVTHSLILIQDTTFSDTRLAVSHHPPFDTNAYYPSLTVAGGNNTTLSIR